MKILIFGLGGVFGASRREHVEHVEHMNGIIDEDQTKELRVSFLIPSTFILPDCPLSFCRTVHFHLNPMSLKNTPKNKRFLLVPYTFKNYGSVLLSESVYRPLSPQPNDLSCMVRDQLSRQIFRKWNQKRPKRSLKNCS